MAYRDQIATIPLGRGGIHSDDPQTSIPATKLILALNATTANGVLERDFGSRRWNETALGTGIVQFVEWIPQESTSRVIAVGSDGNVYRFLDGYSSSTVTGTTALNVSNYVSFASAGAEESGNDKKLFIFTGQSAVQVISGDGTTRADISNGATDWSGTQHPIGGIVHRNRLFAYGNLSDPHRVYASSGTDHENFTTSPLQFSVYPGEAERVVGAFVFKGALFVYKTPFGVYRLIDTDASTSNWYFERAGFDFGGSSPHSAVVVFEDVLLGNDYASISSLRAAQEFGDLTSADVFHRLRASKYADNELTKSGFNERQGIYYKKKQQVFFSFRSKDSQSNDRIAILNYQEPNNPILTWSTKDQPNCLALMKDVEGVERPFYGANDGFIYQMDHESRWVGGDDANQTDYTFDIQTPHMDLSEANPVWGGQEKHWDHLEVYFEPTGDWDLTIEIYLDGKLSVTETINLIGSEKPLDEMALNNDDILDRSEDSHRVPIDGQSRKISVRAYQSGVGRNVRLTKFKVYFRVAGNAEPMKK